MNIIKSIAELRQMLSMQPHHSLGFVPTMGSLHEGHGSLIKQAKQNNDCVIVSIFINRYQFNDINDYKSYPSDLSKDCEFLEDLRVDYVFLPDEKTMYPAGCLMTIHIDNPFASCMEGLMRPGHFSGMLTIVMKLLLLIQPTHAYFGEKDYQQLMLVEKMVASYFLRTIIVRCPTQRDGSKLPLSSRNKNLTLDDKAKLSGIYQLLINDNYNDLPALSATIQDMEVHVEYLQEVSKRIFLAMTIANTRIIDNFLKETGPC